MACFLHMQTRKCCITVNFVSQVTVDLTFSRLIDKYGFRPFAIGGHIAAAAGLGLFALAPLLFGKNVYAGFVLATVVFSVGGGLMEILLSPIVNAIPTKEKAAAMSVLHSFYAWGQVVVVLATTLLLFALPDGWWSMIPVLWMLPAIFNAFFFAKVPLAPAIPEAQRTGMRRILRDPRFLIAMLVIMTGAMAELCMSQWASAFMESALGLDKVLGDTLGMCMFGVMMGIGRAWYGVVGGRVKLSRVMLLGAALCACCYLTAALSGIGWLSLAACALTGLGAALLWPGTLTLAAERFPLAGAVMFAILAAGGDIGASIGPWLVGVIAERAPSLPALADIASAIGPEQLGLRVGLLAAAIFPAASFVGILLFIQNTNKSRPKGGTTKAL